MRVNLQIVVVNFEYRMFKREQTEYLEETLGNGSRRRYVKGRVLGKGGFAKCYEVVEESSRMRYACKVIEKKQLTQSQMQEKLQSEISIHRRVRHPSIVKFEHVFEDEQFIYILLELCINNTLNELLKRRRLLTEIEVRFYLHHLLLAINYLHDQKIVHRDLKLDNFFLSEQLQVKIGDFGLATTVSATAKRRSVCGTPIFIAPEILEGKVGYSYEVDIWSLGVVTYVLLFGKFPFECGDPKSIGQRIKGKAYLINPSVSDPAKTFISGMLQMSPADRLTARQLLKHDFLTAYEIPKQLPRSSLACMPNSNFLEQYRVKKDHLLSPESDEEFHFMLCSKDSPKEIKNMSASKDNEIIFEAAQGKKGEADELKLESDGESFDLKGWVLEWEEFSCGLLYKTSDGLINMRFNDGSTLKALTFPTRFLYFNPFGQATLYQMQKSNPNLPDEVFRKMGMLARRVEHFKLEETNTKEDDLIVKVYYHCLEMFLIWLSNGVLQCRFSDSSQLVLSPSGCIFIAVDKTRTVFSSGSLHEMGDEILSKKKELETVIKRISNLKKAAKENQEVLV